jgi:hypothetical protein
LEKWCNSHKIDDLRRESIVNKTAISAATNKKIGGQAPSLYLPKLQREAETTAEELRRRIERHHVDYDALEHDDFDAHFDARRGSVLGLIAAAMGKAIVEPAVPVLPQDYDLDEEEQEDEDAAEVEPIALG